MLTKQISAPEACNLINKEIGVNANFNAEEGHCVGVLFFFYYFFFLLLFAFLLHGTHPYPEFPLCICFAYLCMSYSSERIGF